MDLKFKIPKILKQIEFKIVKFKFKFYFLKINNVN